MKHSVSVRYQSISESPVFVASMVALLVVGCSGPEPGQPVSIRLIDQFAEARIDGTPVVDGSGADRSWSFAETDRASLWEVGQGIDRVRLEDGAMRGSTTSNLPLLHIAQEGPLDPTGGDLLHHVEVRAQVSAGENLSLLFQDELSVEAAAGRFEAPFPVNLSTPLLPGPDFEVYEIQPNTPIEMSEAAHVILRPSDAKGAEFAIESIRLVSRSEHLASIPSGIGWHGLGGVYRESVVSRSPETIRFATELPQRPRFETAIGTLDAAPLTFSVAVATEGAADRQLIARTRTTPHRWEDLTIDLSDFAGQKVELILSLESDTEKQLGFWGAPAIRSVGARELVGDDSGEQEVAGVILFVADTLRADRLDPYGHSRETAPNLARLGREGAVFESCSSQATWTKVSFSSMMSGLYPPSHGVYGFTDRLPASVRTLAEDYRDAGWSTMAMASITFFGKFTNLHQGFEVFHESSSLPDDLNLKTGRVYMDRFLPWLDQHHETPFFAVVHAGDPHSPFVPYAPYDTMFSEPGAREAHEADVATVEPMIESDLMKRFKMPSTAELERAGISPDAYVARELDWYDASIRGLDAEIGRLLERLEQLGISDQTLIAFTSDHGEEFLEHGRHWHGHSVYGELSRVPLVLRGPGVVPGRVIAEHVQSIDLGPTLLRLSGVESTATRQGESLEPLLGASSETGAWRPKPAFSVAVDTSPEPEDLAWPTASYGMLDGDWMLVHNLERPESFNEFELYDHRNDPLHQVDVAAAHPEVVEQLSAKIIAWRTQAESEKVAETDGLEGVDAAELERLRALGYVN